jgi:hypothetical protein
VERARATTERLESGGLRAIVSTSDLDRDGRIVHQDGWVLDNYRRNPVVMWNHEYMDGAKAFPIGKAQVEVIDGKLTADVTFADTEEGRTVESLYQQGILSSFSAGWAPLEDPVQGEDGEHHLKQELIEFSAVPIPSNPNAQVLVSAALRGVGLEPGDEEAVASPGSSPEPTLTTASQTSTVTGAVKTGPVTFKGGETVIPLDNLAAIAELGADLAKATVGTSHNVTRDFAEAAEVLKKAVTGTTDEDAAAEATALLTPETSADEAEETPEEGDSGEGSAPKQASGLTTRQHAERVAEMTAQVTEQVWRRLTGRLPD